MTPESFQAFVSEHAARVLAIGLPVDENSSYLKGAALAPWEIQKMLFHEAGNPISETGADLSDKAGFVYAGALDANTRKPMQDIENIAEITGKAGRFPVFIGGDHSVTFPIIKGLAKTRKKLSILHIDAHPDLYENYDNNPHSHASPFARIMEAGLVKRLVQVGIRALTGHQRDQAKKYGVEVHEMTGWRGLPKLSFAEPVYISIDMDGIDPAFAPGVSHREPGGLSAREVLNLVHACGSRLIGGDVVEYNPKCDIDGMTATLAARLVREIAGTILTGKRQA